MLEIIIYIVLILILTIVLYKFIYHLILQSDHAKAVNYNKLLTDKKDSEVNNFFLSYPVYYINLERSVERKKYIENMSELFKIDNISRVDAVDGKKLDFNNFLIKGYSVFTNSELACLLSHIKAIKTSYDNNDELCIILEDDTGFGLLTNINYKIDHIIDNAPKDWEYINLCPLNPFIKLSNLSYVSNDMLNGLGASTYIINRKGMEKILNKLYYEDKIVIDIKICKVDKLFSDVLLPNLVKSYNYIDEIFYQNKTFPKEVEFSYAL